MGLSYNKLWKLLIDKKISQADLRKKAKIAPNTMTKLRKDETVNMNILFNICDVLNCNLCDIVEYTPVKNNLSSLQSKRMLDDELDFVNAAGDFNDFDKKDQV